MSGRIFNENINAETIMHGTWVPTIQDASASDAESQTYSLQLGYYMKIGNHVFIQARLVITSLGSLSGALRIGGLPFKSTSVAQAISSISVGQALNLSITASETVACAVGANVNSASLTIWSATTGTVNLTTTEVNDNSEIVIGGHYISED